MKDNIIKFMSKKEKQAVQIAGDRYVECGYSPRWLKFQEDDARCFPHQSSIKISVMTINNDDQIRKICDMSLLKEDLLRAIKSFE